MGDAGGKAEKVRGSLVRKAPARCAKEFGFDLKTMGAAERTLAEERRHGQICFARFPSAATECS